jgi:hypothetical protein
LRMSSIASSDHTSQADYVEDFEQDYCHWIRRSSDLAKEVDREGERDLARP